MRGAVGVLGEGVERNDGLIGEKSGVEEVV